MLQFEQPIRRVHITPSIHFSHDNPLELEAAMEYNQYITHEIYVTKTNTYNEPIEVDFTVYTYNRNSRSIERHRVHRVEAKHIHMFTKLVQDYIKKEHAHLDTYKTPLLEMPSLNGQPSIHALHHMHNVNRDNQKAIRAYDQHLNIQLYDYQETLRTLLLTHSLTHIRLFIRDLIYFVQKHHALDSEYRIHPHPHRDLTNLAHIIHAYYTKPDNVNKTYAYDTSPELQVAMEWLRDYPLLDTHHQHPYMD